jgi:putative ABC transport system permease protein
MKADLRFALRSLRRAPAFFCLAVATLALGIAANTAIFSLFYQVLLRSLPVQQPEQLVLFHSDRPNLPGRTSSDNGETVFSYALYREMRESKSLQGLAARSSTAVQMMVDGVAELRHAEIVSGNFFDVLGIRASAGRLMSPSDDSVRGGNPVTVLSHEFWRRRFGGSGSVLNRTVQLNGQPFAIIGVAPEGFRGVLAGDSPDVFVPISMRAALNPDWDRYDRPSWQWVTILGRLAPGVTRERALAELQPRFAAVIRAHVDQLNVRNESARQRLLAKRLELRPASQGLNSLEQAWRQPLFVLLAMVLLLLVIGCANLVNLLMARAVNRAREISIRLALGAGRARVLRLLLTESALLAIAGTLAGLLFTPVLTRGIIHLLPAGQIGGWLSGEINRRFSSSACC